MKPYRSVWDFLIVTASNAAQAASYRTLLGLRRKLGHLDKVGEILVVPDPEGLRIGSGGSTVLCLLEAVSRCGELQGSAQKGQPAWETLQEKRILIIHAGGDSRRLPAYGPCGKLFIPTPSKFTGSAGTTLFDRQIPIYLALPPNPQGGGQVVVTAGDVYLDFNPEAVTYEESGVNGLGTWTDLETAARHGVFIPGPKGKVRRFLQKPAAEDLIRQEGVDSSGRALLDIGVMNLDAQAVGRLLEIFDVRRDSTGSWTWGGPLGEALETEAVDFFREFTCAMGADTRFALYKDAARAGGSQLTVSVLKRIYDGLSDVPFNVRVLPRCSFYHFGSPNQLVSVGEDLMARERGPSIGTNLIDIDNLYKGDGVAVGRKAWVEGCRIESRLTMGGENVVVGADINCPLDLPRGACLDLLPVNNPDGKRLWHLRLYGIDDTFKLPLGAGARFCGRSLKDWMLCVGCAEKHIWESSISPEQRTLWNARLFPVLENPEQVVDWLWIWDPEKAGPGRLEDWRETRRVSFSEGAAAADHDQFHGRRLRIRALNLIGSPGDVFTRQSAFSALDLEEVLTHLEDEERIALISGILAAAWRRNTPGTGNGSKIENLGLSRILHTLGCALDRAAFESPGSDWRNLLISAWRALPPYPSGGTFLDELDPSKLDELHEWTREARAVAFRHLGRTIVRTSGFSEKFPEIVLRRDEIVWGRAAARLDLGGGWTDTPPYSLERGGRVINAAVNLNGQPPIQVFARRCEKKEIRISSIDHGTDLVVTGLDELLDYRRPTSQFGLAKAALALMGFSPEYSKWPKGIRTLETMLERTGGGGIHLTTLAAIPSGSGLGTSSIMGAVLVAVIGRLTGQELDQRRLFYKVLQLEQELTTGGGWQDQVGGSLPGIKLITTEPGMYPDPRIQYFPSDVLDPAANGGCTLLYYTGLRRLAKNILQKVVGRYLDRDPAALATLSDLFILPTRISETLSGKELLRFGECIEAAWILNKQIDPDSTNPMIEEILGRIREFICGAKLLGAGGGGFLLIVCPSAERAVAVRENLERDPPNPLARFFDFNISTSGLEVSVC